MKLDEYDIKARLIPSILTSIPYFLFSQYYFGNELGKIIGFYTGAVSLIAGLSFPIILIFFSMQMNRYVSKYIYENWYFKKEIAFPTTELLLPSNTEYSQLTKDKIYKRIKKTFKITMPTIKEEKKNKKESQKIVNEVVGLIREKVQKGRLLHEFNIQYGFIRNLIGGATIALIICVLEMWFFYHIKAGIEFQLVILLSIIYSIPILLSKVLIRIVGFSYARRLVTEFLSL